MDLNTIKLLRDTVFVGTSKGIQIFGDNAKLYDTGLDDGQVIWDDTHQLFYAFRQNNSMYNAGPVPIVAEVAEYARLQYFTIPLSYFDLEKSLNILLTAGTITQAQFDVILANCKSFQK